MKIIEEIIDLLSSNEPNISTALLKTKVLLHRLGEKELLEWVNGELQGYENIDNLPEYRVLRLTVRGNVSNLAYRATNHTLPLMHIDKKIRKKLDTSYMTQSIAVIEEYSNSDNLQVSIAPELYPYISQGLGNGYHVEAAWSNYSAGAMTQIITEVKSRLLEFVLELADKFPEELDSEAIKSRSKEVGVSDLFNNAVFGDNATIVVGDSNTQNINNRVTKNDLASLISFLQESGIKENDLEDLSKAIQLDDGSPEHASKELGTNVAGWVGRMLSKAASLAWDIKVGAAGSLLATAIGKYYGF